MSLCALVPDALETNAARQVLFVDLNERWLDQCAIFDHIRTARRELAPCGQIEKARHNAFDSFEPPPSYSFFGQPGYAPEQSFRVRMLRATEDFADGRLFDYAPGIHHGNAVCRFCND